MSSNHGRVTSVDSYCDFTIDCAHAHALCEWIIFNWIRSLFSISFHFSVRAPIATTNVHVRWALFERDRTWQRWPEWFRNNGIQNASSGSELRANSERFNGSLSHVITHSTSSQPAAAMKIFTFAPNTVARKKNVCRVFHALEKCVGMLFQLMKLLRPMEEGSAGKRSIPSAVRCRLKSIASWRLSQAKKHKTKRFQNDTKSLSQLPLPRPRPARLGVARRYTNKKLECIKL